MNSSQRRKFARVLFSELRAASTTEMEAGLIDAVETFVKQEKTINTLRVENAALKEQVAQLERRDIANSVNTNRHWETIAQQAEALRVKDEALQGLHDDNADYLSLNKLDGYDNHWMVLAREALAIQPSPDILRERDARLVDRISDELGISLDDFIDKIRKGDFPPASNQDSQTKPASS